MIPTHFIALTSADEKILDYATGIRASIALAFSILILLKPTLLGKLNAEQRRRAKKWWALIGLASLYGVVEFLFEFLNGFK